MVRSFVFFDGAPNPLILTSGSVDENAKPLEEMEAAHKAEGLILAHARKDQEAMRVEEKRISEEKTKSLQAKLQAMLQELAAEEATASRAFAERREIMARESRAVAQKLKSLQSVPSTTSMPTAPPTACFLGGSFPLSPICTRQLISRTPASVERLRCTQLDAIRHTSSGSTVAFNTGLGPSLSLIVVPPSGAPRPEEDNQE